MWQVQGNSADTRLFEPFEPLEVLYDFDGPRTFTHRDCQGELCLAHWCDEDTEIARFVVAAFAARLIDQLKNGELTLREALNQPRAWIVDRAHSGQVRTAWRVQLSDLPGDVLPMPGTMLLPSLERQPRNGRPAQLAGTAVDADKDRMVFERAKRDIRLIGNQRLGPPDASIQTRLDRVSDLERLDRMLLQAVSASTWEDILNTP